MNYEEAWQELKEQLDSAKKYLGIKQKNLYEDGNYRENDRITSKLEGVKLAQQYMFDIEVSCLEK